MVVEIIPRSEHPISRKNIHPDALKVLYRLGRKGFIAYLVGGGVRDLILGRKPKDFDISTNATPNQIKRLFHNCFLIGRRFRLAHIRFGENIIETSTFRRCPDHDQDNDNGDLYVLRDNCYGSPAEDALRRDFTINGLFYEVKKFTIIDHVGGLKDIQARLIRSIGDPNIRFQEDPVRMIRAIRFAARLDFEIEPVTYNAIVRHHGQILKASPPRVFEELHSLFAYGSGQKSMELLYKTRLLHDLLPELADFLDHNHGQNSVFWSWLSLLDLHIQQQQKTEPALIFATLFSAPIQHIIAEHKTRGQRIVLMDLLGNLLLPICMRISMPKAMAARMLQIMANQSRFVPDKRKRFSKRGFVAQDCFPETLALYEIALGVADQDLSQIQPWQQLRRQWEQETPSGAKGTKNFKKRRPARRRRPRRPKT